MAISSLTGRGQTLICIIRKKVQLIYQRPKGLSLFLSHVRRRQPNLDSTRVQRYWNWGGQESPMFVGGCWRRVEGARWALDNTEGGTVGPIGVVVANSSEVSKSHS